MCKVIPPALLKTRSKKGFTLPEVIVSVLFTAIIFATAVSIWFVGGKVFNDTEGVSLDYNQARAFETMVQNGASVAPSLDFTSNLASSTPDFGSSLPPGKSAADYFRFFYDEDQRAYSIEYYIAGEPDPMVIAYDALESVDDVRIGFSDVGKDVLLEYQIARLDDGTYLINGGIVLNYVEPGSYPGTRNLDYNLFFHKEDNI